MPTLFATPDPDLEDQQVIAEIHDVRASFADFLRVPKRWNGLLRRTATARAIQGSNTIEGYTVSDEDAVAAVDDEPPLTADEATWMKIVAYRRVLTYACPRPPVDVAPTRSSSATIGGVSTSTREPAGSSCQDSCGRYRSPWSRRAPTTRWYEEPWRTSISS